ncbi:DNA ligase D [Rossellomorea vietnamensis]|uniref:DNA ligase D n=1 Tax=Rossellomorea vietnamensis TaxID=218284 RepID=A0A5D4MI34_9BACI|nr:DNA ligase D [Rossellomorea vietnamensis]TYS01575.1 DNA ligase D [Rossellomorea vietnamensis]
MKPMLPTLFEETPVKGNWNYEVKYDGFRGILTLRSEKEISLISRNGKELLPQFPEIRDFFAEILSERTLPLPIVLDGEIVLLENDFKSNFSGVQTRGRMKSAQNIEKAADLNPCTFLAFDLLEIEGINFTGKPYLSRKKALKDLFKNGNIPLKPVFGSSARIQMIPAYNDSSEVLKNVRDFDGEGLIAKDSGSLWEEGRRTSTWRKMKNWRKASCFILSYDSKNGYYDVGVFNEEKIISIGSFYFGISPEEKDALNSIIKENAYKSENGKSYVNPGICVELNYLEWYENQMREPHFHQFLFHYKPEECTWERLMTDEASLPEVVEITHPDKPLWDSPAIDKLQYIRYLRKVSSRLLFFLRQRPLTVIRLPHGMFGESFYQKNCPDYAPDFIKTIRIDNIDYILCNDLETLMWLGNQLAIEFHIPFQKAESSYVNEIVFDLDPPSRDYFHLAVKAAQEMKKLFDQLNLISFIKTSGNKGLQVYIPLPDGYSWSDTHLFTEFIADYLTNQYPDEFTTERLKKNRNNRLYVDYIQHAEGKTIISPYSPRANEDALISAPLFWDELTEDLRPEQFTMKTVLERLNKMGCPFAGYEEAKEKQNIKDILSFLKSKRGKEH